MMENGLRKRQTSVMTTPTKAPLHSQESTKTSTPMPSTPLTPLHNYFSRRRSTPIQTHELPLERNSTGYSSPWALLWGAMFFIAPLCYFYILVVLVRELCPLLLAKYVGEWILQTPNTVLEGWCVLEAIWWLCLKLQVRYLQYKDTLEASLSSAPMMEESMRQTLWNQMMDVERGDVRQWITGWFFDHPLETIDKSDVRDFVAWSMFEGRNLEHLTVEEFDQLQRFVQELEQLITIELYGSTNDENRESNVALEDDETNSAVKSLEPQVFTFPEETQEEQPNFFSNLYESYRHSYQQYREMMSNADFHPVQEIRNFVSETAYTAQKLEESAMAKAHDVAHGMYEKIIQPGSNMDKQLTSISRQTQLQFDKAWNSMEKVKERLETAEILNKQRKRIRQQLKGYQLTLSKMRAMSSAVPSKQMASVLKKITECNEALIKCEAFARDAFVTATGFARHNLSPREPKRYAKYSGDPLLSIATYPLGLHLVALGLTEVPLRILMKRRGFQYCSSGPTKYYFHPGDEDVDEKDPIVFVHGIGLGVIVYLPLVDALLKSGRPIFIPEIPYVCAFRPWQSPDDVLAPAVVCSTMTAMLATHGQIRASFIGHSYGTSWLSYMCKYAPHAVSSVLFLDPICFCLHYPTLTKSFVYHRPDPGSIAYVVRTDVMVSWTIQRSFPWAWICLFLEDIKCPCGIFLSEEDVLVPFSKVENYMRERGAKVVDTTELTSDHFKEGDCNVAIFRGAEHGGWIEEPSTTAPLIADAVQVLYERVESTSS